jgi:hypothetical protein
LWGIALSAVKLRGGGWGIFYKENLTKGNETKA